MISNIGSTLLDAVVLVVVSRDADGTYGYKITQGVQCAIDIPESILYLVFRWFQKEDRLEIYDMVTDGRDRRYYEITEKGQV